MGLIINFLMDSNSPSSSIVGESRRRIYRNEETPSAAIYLDSQPFRREKLRSPQKEYQCPQTTDRRIVPNHDFFELYTKEKKKTEDLLRENAQLKKEIVELKVSKFYSFDEGKLKDLISEVQELGEKLRESTEQVGQAQEQVRSLKIENDFLRRSNSQYKTELQSEIKVKFGTTGDLMGVKQSQLKFDKPELTRTLKQFNSPDRSIHFGSSMLSIRPSVSPRLNDSRSTALDHILKGYRSCSKSRMLIKSVKKRMSTATKDQDQEKGDSASDLYFGKKSRQADRGY